jgi:hypothetical protein
MGFYETHILINLDWDYFFGWKTLSLQQVLSCKKSYQGTTKNEDKHSYDIATHTYKSDFGIIQREISYQIDRTSTKSQQYCAIIGNTAKVTQATCCQEVTGSTGPSIFKVAFGPV